MKYLFLMGASGSGKTTLAKNLNKYAPNNYKRIIQHTTRKKRAEETEGDDYFFVSDVQFDNEKNTFFETVEHQFLPSRYGAKEDFLDLEKWNIVVVCIEGFLSAFKHLTIADQAILINILVDDELDVSRENRDPLFEERVNLGVLNQFIKEKNMLKIDSLR